jgi:hypothetical protein
VSIQGIHKSDLVAVHVLAVRSLGRGAVRQYVGAR